MTVPVDRSGLSTPLSCLQLERQAQRSDIGQGLGRDAIPHHLAFGVQQEKPAEVNQILLDFLKQEWPA